MKKLVAYMLAVTLVFGVVGCSGNQNPAGDGSVVTADETEGKSSLDIVKEIWAAYEEDEKFPISGGDSENMAFDEPGEFDVTKTEDMDYLLGVPEDAAALIDDAASLVHALNQNTFTAGVYHVTDAGQVQAFADALKENILNRHWMCGFPDTLVIFSVGSNCVIAAFGNDELIDNFEDHVEDLFQTETLLCEEALAY
ncbi:MAG: hypothetical protein ACI4DV_08780 [Lachnospiraceae bacterium]